MSDYKHLGKVDEEGKLKLYHQPSFLEDLRHFKGADVEIVLRKTSKRTNQQNKYYWSGVVPIVRKGLYDIGIKMSLEQVHTLLKFRFLKVELSTGDGEIMETIGSSAELNTEEFNDFIANIQQWSAEYLHLEIPDPGEQTTLYE